MEDFSYKQMIGKGVKYFIGMALGFLVYQAFVLFPDIVNLQLADALKKLVDLIPVQFGTLTVGTLVLMGLNWLKNKLGLRLP